MYCDQCIQTAHVEKKIIDFKYLSIKYILTNSGVHRTSGFDTRKYLTDAIKINIFLTTGVFYKSENDIMYSIKNDTG